MEMSQSLRKAVKASRQRGFTLIETMVSILILTIGWVGTAALMSNSVNMGAHARYVSTAARLAFEKMEDLDRFPDNDPNLTPGGSLTADITGYSDSVQISTANGNINEVPGVNS
jgi:prepilin-type N-terminal cleavage/methylation domain-containing protein